MNLCVNISKSHLGLQPRQLDGFDDVDSGLVPAQRVLAPGNVAGVLRVLREQVDGPRVEEVLSVLQGGGGGHDVEVSITDPAVGSVVPVVLEVLQGVGRHHVTPFTLVQAIKLVGPNQFFADGCDDQ